MRETRHANSAVVSSKNLKFVKEKLAVRIAAAAAMSVAAATDTTSAAADVVKYKEIKQSFSKFSRSCRADHGVSTRSRSPIQPRPQRTPARPTITIQSPPQSTPQRIGRIAIQPQPAQPAAARSAIAAIAARPIILVPVARGEVYLGSKRHRTDDAVRD